MRSGGVVDWESIKEFLSKSILENSGLENKIYTDGVSGASRRYSEELNKLKSQGKGFNIDLTKLISSSGRGKPSTYYNNDSIISGNKAIEQPIEAPTIQSVARPAPAAKTEPTNIQTELSKANDSVMGAGNVLIGVKQLLESGVPERDIAEALASIKRGGEAEGLEGQSLKDYYKSLF